MRRVRSRCCARAASGHAAAAPPTSRDELASLHSITSSARASSVGGTARPLREQLASLLLTGPLDRLSSASDDALPHAARRSCTHHARCSSLLQIEEFRGGDVKPFLLTRAR
jgi:hypothetical protein